MDGAYWTNKKGTMFFFTHIIDQGTLWAPSGREIAEQIRIWENLWFQWAGPCKALYLDPAGEYRGEKLLDFAQREGVHIMMSAGESPWQLGRCEVHGGIVKRMLTHMDQDRPIDMAEDFQCALRQAFHAKNSLS